MKKIDWESAYGNETPEFHDALVHVLHQEEKPMKRKSFAAVLVAALVIVLLAATALAIANRAGLLEFFGGYEMDNNPLDYSYRLGEDGVLLSDTFGDLQVEVTEGVAEGQQYAFVTTIALKPGVKGELVSPLDWLLSESESYGPATSTDGSPVYYVDTMLLHEGGAPDVNDARINEDGSISFLSRMRVPEAGDTAQMACMVQCLKAESGELADPSGTEVALLPFVIETERTLDARKLLEPVEIPEVTMTVQEVLIKQSASSTVAYIYYEYAGGETVDYLSPSALSLRLMDSDGNVLSKEGWNGIGRQIEENRYRASFPLNEGVLPDTMVLELWARKDGFQMRPGQEADVVLGKALLPLEAISVTDGTPNGYGETIGGYMDYRNIDLPWVEQLPRVMYLTTDQEEGIPVYRFPDEGTEPLGYFYSGLPGEPLAAYRDWTIFFIGDEQTDYMGMHVYVKTEHVSATSDGVPPGVLKGTINARTDTRLAPGEQVTIFNVLEEGTEVCVLGSSNGWCFVAARGRYGLIVKGYVPEESVTLTGEKLALEPVGADEDGYPIVWEPEPALPVMWGNY